MRVIVVDDVGGITGAVLPLFRDGGTPSRVVEDLDTTRAGHALHQPDQFRMVGRAQRVVVVEIADRALVVQQHETFSIEFRLRQLRACIIYLDLMGTIVAQVLGLVPAALRRHVNPWRRQISQKLELRSKRIVRGMFQRLLSGFP